MRKYCSLMLLVMGVSLASGCAGMTKNMPWADKSSQITQSKYQAPVKMVALWSPAMYNAPGKPATRGFGGRLYFYNAKNEAVPVQGQLVVYCFDDTNKTNDHKQADRRVAFTPEQFSSHFSPTELGASYSVWVPWDAVGNSQAEISLVPIFTAASGQVVVGEQSLGLLPGPESPIQEKSLVERIYNPTVKQDGSVTRVGYDQELPGSVAARHSGINTLSIDLPQNLAERVAANSNQESGLLPRANELAGVQPKPLLPQLPVPRTAENGIRTNVPMGSSSGESNHLFPPLAPSTHSERSRLQAPTLQPPQPTLGPAPMQLPLGERPSSLP